MHPRRPVRQQQKLTLWTWGCEVHDLCGGAHRRPDSSCAGVRSEWGRLRGDLAGTLDWEAQTFTSSIESVLRCLSLLPFEAEHQPNGKATAGYISEDKAGHGLFLVTAGATTPLRLIFILLCGSGWPMSHSLRCGSPGLADFYLATRSYLLVQWCPWRPCPCACSQPSILPDDFVVRVLSTQSGSLSSWFHSRLLSNPSPSFLCARGLVLASLLQAPSMLCGGLRGVSPRSSESARRCPERKETRVALIQELGPWTSCTWIGSVLCSLSAQVLPGVMGFVFPADRGRGELGEDTCTVAELIWLWEQQLRKESFLLPGPYFFTSMTTKLATDDINFMY